jgi:hypothetical protein
MGGSNKELHNLSYSLNKHYYYNQIRIIWWAEHIACMRLKNVSRLECLLPCVNIFVRKSENNLCCVPLCPTYIKCYGHELKQAFADLLKVLCSCMIIWIKVSIRPFCSACSLVGMAGTAAGRQSAVFFMKIFHQLTNWSGFVLSSCEQMYECIVYQFYYTREQKQSRNNELDVKLNSRTF